MLPKKQRRIEAKEKMKDKDTLARAILHMVGYGRKLSAWSIGNFNKKEMFEIFKYLKRQKQNEKVGLRVLVTSEVAEALRISNDYARELLRRGVIPGYKEGRRGGFRVLEKDVDAYVKRKMKEA